MRSVQSEEVESVDDGGVAAGAGVGGVDGWGVVGEGEVEVIDSVMGYMIEWGSIPDWVTAVVAVGFGVGGLYGDTSSIEKANNFS